MPDTFWQQKLLAFLHDPPDKCRDTGPRHEEQAARNQAAAGFPDEGGRIPLSQAVRAADHFASAAERFVFPKKKCSHSFTDEPLFIHPLSSKLYDFPVNTGKAMDDCSSAIQAAHGGIGQGNDVSDWRARFFLHWRRWQENATAQTLREKEAGEESANAAWAFLPADSRIPDHSIWNHMAIASALAGCVRDGAVQPELLLFHFGPVQDFIEQARSCRDLWSGSYLISWLMAHALKAVTDEIGPDSVVFPSLRGNGIFDALHRDTLYSVEWDHGRGKRQTTWERLMDDKGDEQNVADWLLTPTLPNRFLAIVPPDRGAELAQRATQAIRAELADIAGGVWRWLIANGASEAWKARFDEQVAAFPQTAWAVQPWLDRKTCLARTEQVDTETARRVREIFALGEEVLPHAERDGRYYTDAVKKERLNSPGLLWSAHYALLEAKLAARRNTRDFAQWKSEGAGAVKDSLSGKEECIGGEEFWKKLTKEHEAIFTAPSHRYGAMNLIKRLWCRDDCVPYLREKLGLNKEAHGKAMRFSDTRDIADGKYIAVLAMDGDNMGKWLSGENTPALTGQFSPEAQKYLHDILGKQNIKEPRRLLTPSYHLQFSEALANFAIHHARKTVEEQEHGGELLYAGGDDVLAILPASRAIDCAKALREIFRKDFCQGRILPGCKCELSGGIAVGHHAAPLQMLVAEARAALSRAKAEDGYGRAALAVSVYKRSGEILHWGCKWDSPALELLAKTTEHSDALSLSGRFPYALAELLKPYRLDSTKALSIASDALTTIIAREFEHVLERQASGLKDREKESFRELALRYLNSLPAKHLDDFPNLFLVETFLNRFNKEA